MKKAAIVFLLLFFCISLTWGDNIPAFMIEFNTGYSVGINMDNTFQFDVKLYYPLSYPSGRFGFVILAGGLLTPDESYKHIYMGPILFFNLIPKWRVPLSIGFDIMGGDTTYLGIGSTVGVHHSLTKNIYTGLNLGVTFAMNNKYSVLTGHRQNVTTFDDGTTLTQTVPIFENRSHYGNRWLFMPSLIIGFQY